MARVSTYLNFQGQTEEAFAFYAKTFGTAITMLSRYSDMPAAGPGELPAEERNLVMHAELPIIGGHVLMATDMLRSMGQETRIGNNTTLCLDVDSREEADGLYGTLSEGGSEGSPMADMPWGSYWGVILDRYGIRWMVNHTGILNDRQPPRLLKGAAARPAGRRARRISVLGQPRKLPRGPEANAERRLHARGCHGDLPTFRDRRHAVAQAPQAAA